MKITKRAIESLKSSMKLKKIKKEQQNVTIAAIFMLRFQNPHVISFDDAKFS